MKVGRVVSSVASLAGIILAGTAALAHHSFAMFDRERTVTLVGTVRNWQWTNPHTWLWLTIPGSNGASTIWGLEGTAPGELTRKGWARESLKVGDKVTVVINPLRDGRNGGSFHTVTFADGRKLTDNFQISGAPK